MKYKFYGTAAAEGIPGLFCECENCRRAKKLGDENDFLTSYDDFEVEF